MTTTLEFLLAQAREQGIADAEAERMAAKAAEPSPEVKAFKQAFGVPPIDTTQAEEDKELVMTVLGNAAHARDRGEGNRASAMIDNLVAKIGVERFMAAAPPNVAAKMRAQIKEDRKREKRKAERAALRNPPKPKPAAKIDGMKAWAIRSRGTQAEIDALNALEAAEEAAREEAEGAKALARNIHFNTLALNGTGKSAAAGEDPQAVWSRAIAANNPTPSK